MSRMTLKLKWFAKHARLSSVMKAIFLDTSGIRIQNLSTFPTRILKLTSLDPDPCFKNDEFAFSISEVLIHPVSEFLNFWCPFFIKTAILGKILIRALVKIFYFGFRNLQIPAPYQASIFPSDADLGCLSRIPETNFFHSGSRIRIIKCKYFDPLNSFLSSRKYDPGCSSRIRIRIFYPSCSRIQGSKKHQIPVPDPQHLFF